MKRLVACCLAVVLATAGTAYALYSVSETGDWPKTWPAELEGLRKQSRTLVGPEIDLQQFHLPFKDRATFEAMWPHLVKVKSKGAPIILIRSPYTWLGDIKSGVIVHSPPKDTDKKANPELPLNSTNVYERWMWTNYIELIVDGDVVDLNRVPLPAETPIVDRRFEPAKK